MNSGRQGSVLIISVLIVFGLLISVSICSAAGDKWSKKANMPTPRQALSTSSVNGKIYAIGGVRIGWIALPTVEEYDPVTDTWTEKADMPTARWSFSTSVVDNKIYAIGGWNGSMVSAVEEYDPAIDKWTSKANMPTPRNWLSTSVVDGKIYVFGGIVANGLIETATVEEYDPATDTWTKKTNMPTARYGQGSYALEGKIYVIGGGVYRNNVETPIASVEEYDPRTDTWTEKDDMPEPYFVDQGIDAVNGEIYIFGGWKNNLQNNVATNAEKTAQSYDPVTGTWNRKADMLIARGNSSASKVNGRIYVIGGTSEFPVVARDFVALSSVDEYTPEGWQSVSPENKLTTMWGSFRRDR